jgi:putative tryptophan/tyrosine transport system substrate-binding protein
LREDREKEISDREELMNQKKEFLSLLSPDFCSIHLRSAIRNSKSAILVCALLFALSFMAAMLFALCSSAEAQQTKKVPRIGFLATVSPSTISDRVEAFRQGLRELGYVEGKNIVIEWRYAEGKADRLPGLAAELVRLKVDIIVTTGPVPTRSAKTATSTIPIVMTNDPDPVADGFIASLARPGGNVTGLSSLTSELSGKRLEFLKEIVPRLSRVAVLRVPNYPGNAQAFRETELAARALSVQLQYLDVTDTKSIESAFREAVNGRADAVLLLGGGSVFILQRKQIAALAVTSRLPTIHYRHDFVEDGGLISYATSVTDLTRRAATYVDKILKGAKPADLPVEQPTKFELIINLQAAKQIGLTVAPNVLARADRIIR